MHKNKKCVDDALLKVIEEFQGKVARPGFKFLFNQNAEKDNNCADNLLLGLKWFNDILENREVTINKPYYYG